MSKQGSFRSHKVAINGSLIIPWDIFSHISTKPLFSDWCLKISALSLSAYPVCVEWANSKIVGLMPRLSKQLFPCLWACLFLVALCLSHQVSWRDKANMPAFWDLNPWLLWPSGLAWASCCRFTWGVLMFSLVMIVSPITKHFVDRLGSGIWRGGLRKLRAQLWVTQWIDAVFQNHSGWAEMILRRIRRPGTYNFKMRSLKLRWHLNCLPMSHDLVLSSLVSRNCKASTPQLW